jgi:hypothetical protein
MLHQRFTYFFFLIVLSLNFTLAKAYGQEAQNPFDPRRYEYIDPQQVVPKAPLWRLLRYYDQVKSRLKNPNYLSVVDFTPHHSQPRFHLIDMRTGEVKTYLVAHGIGSDPNKTGYASRFSNIPDSLMSSLGIARTGETYVGKWGYSLRLDGLEPSNSRLRERAIVVHWADYVNPEDMGWSEGCFALTQKDYREVIDRIEGGSLLIAWIDPEVLKRRR